MRIDEAEAQTEQPTAFDQRQDFGVFGANRLLQVLKQLDHERAVGKTSHRDFSGDERVADQGPGVERSLQVRIGAPEMVDPDRAVDEQQRALPGSAAGPG